MILTCLNMSRVMVAAPPTHSIVWIPFVLQIALWWHLWATVLLTHLSCCHHSATSCHNYSNTSEHAHGYVAALPTHSIVQKHLGCTTSHCLAYRLLMLPSWCYMLSQLFWHFWTCQGLWWRHPRPIPLFKNLWVYKSHCGGISEPLSVLHTCNVASTVLHVATTILTLLNMPRVMVAAPWTHSIVWISFCSTNSIVVASATHYLAYTLVMLPSQFYLLLQSF